MNNWVVYIEGMCLPYSDGMPESMAKEQVRHLEGNGVMATVVEGGSEQITRQFGRSVVDPRFVTVEDLVRRGL